jgi:4'-phosphopantetheinyl transferase EntD
MNATGGRTGRLVWRTCPIHDQPDREDWAWLAPHDRAHAEAIGHGQARIRFVVGRALLRRTIAELRPDLHAPSLELGIAASGRPYVVGHRDLRLSLSHTRGLAAAAVSSRGTLGIDVEPSSRGGLPPTQAWLTPDEERHLATLPPEAASRWLLDLWVAKEAAIKACDERPVARRDLEVRGRSGGTRPTLAVVLGAGAAAPAVAMDLMWPSDDPGFALAIALPVLPRAASRTDRMASLP